MSSTTYIKVILFSNSMERYQRGGAPLKFTPSMCLFVRKKHFYSR